MRKLVYFSVFFPVAWASVVSNVLGLLYYVAPEISMRLFRFLMLARFLGKV